MNSCSRCNAMYAVFHDLSEILQNEEPEELPEGLHENIMAGVRRSAIEKKNRRMRATWVRTGLTAAACAVLVLFAARGLSPAGRTEGNVIRNSEEVQMSAPAPAQEPAAAAEESAPAPAEAEKPVQTPSPAPAQTPAPAHTQVPAQTPAPVQTQVPAQTPAPVHTPAPVQTPDPYLGQHDSAGTQTAANDAAAPTVPAAPATTVPVLNTPAPTVTAEASAPETTPVQVPAAAQSPTPAETTQDLPSKTDTTADAARKADSGAAPPAALQAAAPAESPAAPAETVTADVADLLGDSGTGEAAAFVDSSAVQETPAVEAEEAPKSFLKSFRTLLRSPAPALAIPMEESEAPETEPETTEQPTATEQPAESPAVSATPLPSPSATPAKESSFRLSGKENQKKLTDLLGGEAKTLPEKEADAIVNVTFVPEDPFGGEEELSIRYYGDKVYYVTYPEGKDPKSFLADCDAAELKALIRELRGDKSPVESPAVSPTTSPAATADPFLPDVPEGS